MSCNPEGTAAQTAANRRAAAIIAAFLAARLIFAFALGLGVDESYTLAISRDLSLSYFDHPPLHQWIAHFTAAALGEGVVARLPFVALFAATGWLLFRLTSELFGPRAGLVSLFGLNAAPFFFASAGTWIVPDGPLLFGLAVAALWLSRAFFDSEPDGGRAWKPWLLAAFGFGIAGLSKYTAVLAALGLLGFVMISHKQRRWLRCPQPYVAAVLALAMVVPVFVWNAEHGWVSFLFQSARADVSGAPKALGPLRMALEQIAYLSPWLFLPLAAGLASGLRLWRDDRRLLMLCLSLPPIVLFTLTPLWGDNGLPHWAMPGWFFVFPLMGAWADEVAIPYQKLRGYALASAGLLAALTVAVVVEARTGWMVRFLSPGVADPTLEAFDWDQLRAAPIFRTRPAFVVATKWSDAGKIAMALGPQTPIFVASIDPRGWAFVASRPDLVGRDGVLIVPKKDMVLARAMTKSLFGSLGQAQAYAITRNGAPVIELALIPAASLRVPLPLPAQGNKNQRRPPSKSVTP